MKLISKKVASIAVALLMLFVVISCTKRTTKSESLASFDLSSSYNITAILDPENKTLEHTTEVKICNNGQGSTGELYFHLYGNLYKTENEGIEIATVTDEKGKSIPFVLKDDNQLVLLTLGDALGSGEETIILFTCKVIIPEMANIFGVARDGEIHLPFFYPQLAVYDKDGWNTKALAQVGDGRYTEMSDYMITISAPSEYEIVCNGVELSRVAQDSQTAYVFQAAQRRELFVAAFTDYNHFERIVGNTRILGYFHDTPGSLIDMGDMDSVMDAAAFSMEYYNRILMDYPYETLIVMRSAWTSHAVNMEYSGLFTIAAMGDENGEHATYHEMAHQWFYFLVGNNENAEPWLDEAFAEFASVLCLEAAGYTEVVADRWEFQKTVSYIYMDGEAINVSYDKASNYTNLFYNRGAYFLKELMDAIGKDEFLSILSEYCETYAYRFATTEAFLILLRERTPVSIDGVIDKYIR